MSDLGRVLEAAGFRISGGTDYCWTSWPEARYIDLESDYATGHVVFSTEDQTVYSVEFSDKPGTYAYRWLNPEWEEEYRLEAERRGVDTSKAWDDVNHADTACFEDILVKLRAAMHGEEFDTRVVVQFEISDDALAAIARYSFEHDCTANEAVVGLLERSIAEAKAEARCPATDPDICGYDGA